MAKIVLEVPEAMKNWLEARADIATHADIGGVVRDLIQQTQDRERVLAELQAEIDKGIASGICDQTVEEIWQEALDEYDRT